MISYAHSYIVDFDDKIVRALFTDKEWNKLVKDQNGVSSIPCDIAEELSKYRSKTLKELCTKVMKSYLKDDEEYDVQKHYNQEWIQMTMRTLCNLFKNIDTPLVLVRTQYEDWFMVALFGNWCERGMPHEGSVSLPLHDGICLVDSSANHMATSRCHMTGVVCLDVYFPINPVFLQRES
jgi:hypothetical protein